MAKKVDIQAAAKARQVHNEAQRIAQEAKDAFIVANAQEIEEKSAQLLAVLRRAVDMVEHIYIPTDKYFRIQLTGVTGEILVGVDDDRMSAEVFVDVKPRNDLGITLSTESRVNWSTCITRNAAQTKSFLNTIKKQEDLINHITHLFHTHVPTWQMWADDNVNIFFHVKTKAFQQISEYAKVVQDRMHKTHISVIGD